jgi:3-oxoacyl-[acyl-carrier protein] reductase
MLTNKIALVTGASRGIGKSIALALANAGAIVIGTATSAAGAADISHYLKEINAKGQGMCLDVKDSTSIHALVADITAQYGAPNILVNNAAITRDNLFIRMKDDEWNDVINVNLSAAYHLNKACIKAMMKARWGRIVTIGSIVGTIGNPGQANYCAAKAGVVGMTKSIALELASRGITANLVAPGFIDTDMTKSLSDEQRAALLKQIPMGAVGQPEDIAHAVLFLVSEQSKYITGQTLHVNGGMFLN